MYRGVLFIQMGDMTPRLHRPCAQLLRLDPSWPPGLNASSLAPTDATNMTAWQGRLEGVEH